MVSGRPSILMKSTIDTKFHIDYDWWNQANEDLRTYLLSHLQPADRERLAQAEEGRVVDYIDPHTAEVFQLDELGLAIQQAAEQPDFINLQISLVDSVFRAFLANGNAPLSPRELSDITGRPASLILKTLGSVRVYKGLRPFIEKNEE